MQQLSPPPSRDGKNSRSPAAYRERGERERKGERASSTMIPPLCRDEEPVELDVGLFIRGEALTPYDITTPNAYLLHDKYVTGTQC